MRAARAPWMDAGMSTLIRDLKSRGKLDDKAAAERWRVRRQPLPARRRAVHGGQRVGHVREIANATLFFASGESSYCTGTHLMVDGGQTSCTVMPEDDH